MIFAKRIAGASSESAALYRVWIFTYDDWQPISCSDLPREAVALGEAESRTFTFDEAARYVKTFNRTALAVSVENKKKVWAVAFPVAVLYHGEPRRGQRLLANNGNGVAKIDNMDGQDEQNEQNRRFALANGASAIRPPAQEKSPLSVRQVSAQNGLPPREFT